MIRTSMYRLFAFGLLLILDCAILLGVTTMAHGAPDWGGTAPATIISNVQDLGELAARLRSVDTFDRRGNVVYADGFEQGLAPYTFTVYGADSYYELTNAHSLVGRWSTHLYLGTAATPEIAISKSFGVGRVSQTGLEISFFPYNHYNRLLWDIDFYAGATFASFAVKYDTSTSELYYWSNLSTWVSFSPAFSLWSNDFAFHTAKLVVDLQHGKYVRFIFDDVQYDLSGILAPVAASMQARHLTTYMESRGDGVAFAETYIDNWIVTINEP